MAKSGLKIYSPQQPVRPDGKLQRTNCQLNKFIASTLATMVKRGQPLFSNEQWKTNAPLVLRNGEEVFEIRPFTYNQWIKRDNIVPELNVTLRELLDRAREERRFAQHEEQRTGIIREAQSILAQLQSLPLGTSTKLERKSFRYRMKQDNNGNIIDRHEFERTPSSESYETITKDLDPQIIEIKRKGAEYALDRLDPHYSPKQENKNLTVVVSLKDLREAAERNKQAKVDYEQ